MNNLLQNLQQNLQKIPQSAKVGAVALLFAAALTTWGLIAFRPTQEPQAVAATSAPVATQPGQATTPQPGQAVTTQPGQAVTTQPDQTSQGQPAPSSTTQSGQAANPVASRPLEVVPIPFLRSSTANTTGGAPANATTNPASAEPSSATIAKTPARPALPPNPFAPLISETPNPTTTASAVPGQQPAQPNFPTPTANGVRPIQTQQPRVQVSQPQTGLPRIPGLAGSRSTPTVNQQQNPIAQNPNTVRVQPGGNALPQTNRPNTNTARPGNSTTTATTNNNNSTAQAQIRPGGSARLTPGGSANNAPGSISPAAGALPIRISPLERELVRPNLTPALTPPSETPAANPTAQTTTPTTDPTPTTTATVEVETPSVGVLDGSAPQSERNPDFSGIQVGGRTNTASPEIRNEIARPRPQQQTTTPTTPTVNVVPPNLIETYVRDQNLRLANVVLGATNVAIFQSKDGFVVLPVGATLPNSNILLRSLNAREALLVLGTDEVNLPVQNP